MSNETFLANRVLELESEVSDLRGRNTDLRAALRFALDLTQAHLRVTAARSPLFVHEADATEHVQ